MSLKGAVTARPIRVAYLIPQDGHSDSMLDAVFAECHSRWGGRFSLLVPVKDGALEPSYLPWLTAYDPDIIYSYADLADSEVRMIHERLGPSELLKHRDNEARDVKDARYYRPNLRCSCLSSLSIAPAYARAFPPSAPQPIHLVDYGIGQPRDRFIDDNFGSYYDSFHHWPLPVPLADCLQPLHVASADRQAEVSRLKRAQTLVADTAELLTEMSKNRNSFGVAQLSADAAPRLDTGYLRNDSFNLVIGMSFKDRLSFWNHRFFAPTYLGREMVTLIVDPSRLDDDKFFNALVAFLKTRNDVQNPNGTPWVTLRTSSLTKEQLTPIQAKFQTADSWNGYHLEPERNPWPAAPDEKSLRDRARLVTGGMFERTRNTVEITLQTETSLPQQAPNHLAHLARSAVTRGAWAIDVSLSRETIFGNSAWLLPRRLRMHGAFNTKNSSLIARSNLGGELTVFTELSGKPVELSIPDNEYAFRHAFERGEDWLPYSGAPANWTPRGIYPWSATSDKGRYFLGAQRLFGDVEQMSAILLHKYWDEVFELLGASIGDERRDAIKNTLRKRFRSAKKLETEEEFDVLAGVVAKFSYEVRNPQNSISLDDLEDRHEPYMANEKRLLEEQKTPDPQIWIDRAASSLFGSIERMARKGILLQGFDWRCGECFHSNWTGIAQLKPVLACEACGKDAAAPVEQPWDFKLHGFVLKALKEHGLLPVVWAINELARTTFNGFYFLPPHEFLSGYPGEKGTERLGEGDLICVVGTDVVLVEAKTSSQGIDLENLIKTALRLRPNRVVLAIMEKASAKAKAKLEELKTGLNGSGINCSLLVTSDETFEDDADLP